MSFFQKIEDRINSIGQGSSVDLSNLDLTEVPELLNSYLGLKKINLSGNKLTKLPSWFSKFNQLELLDLRSNKLKSLCKDFNKLSRLEVLYLRDNMLTEVPVELLLLPNLKTAFLSSNYIKYFTSDFFNIPNVSIEGNPVIDPPIEVFHRGLDAVKNYFAEREQGTEYLNEAKLLIVGEPGAGKTSLMNKILNEDYVLNPFLPSTKGIEIEPFFFKTEENKKFRINIWDFGGQEIYHATHQFFLTKRSLYIILCDNRAEDTDFNYWLQTIELLSDSSPIIIVQNEKQDRKKDVNEVAIKERYTTLKRVFGFNLANDNAKLRGLVDDLKSRIVKLSHIGTELPKIWVDIRRELENRAKKVPYINESEYLEICFQFGMDTKERANYLSDYLHDLGVFLHFKDNAILKRWIILKPDWGTEAVYKVLDDDNVIESKGYFTRNDLKRIWSSSAYADMHEELISLMMKFELCYQLEGKDTLIAAQLLDRVKPAYHWIEEENLIIKYDYFFMPKGVITRFIVKMHYYITSQKLAWREGVVLERQNTRAEIIETYGAREIKIRIQGKNKKEFLAVIIDSLDNINITYNNLKVSKLIPCNCEGCKKNEEPYYFKYQDIRKFLDNEIDEDRCRESMRMVKLRPLIDDAFGYSIKANNEGPLVYISYNDQNRSEKNRLEKHLKILERNKKIRIFDRQYIDVGTDEKQLMREQIDEAEVILLLLSAEYISDDWNYNAELSKAFDRSENQSCVTIPILLSDCNYSLLSISKLKPITFRGKSLFDNPYDTESALASAVNDIKKSIDLFLFDKENKRFTTISQNIEIHDNESDSDRE